MAPTDWQTQKVHGRDEVLREFEKRADAYASTIVQDVRAVMHDYEVDMYRLVMTIGKHHGMDQAYAIMSETVAEKRLKWLEQVKPTLEFNGMEVEKGLALYLRYFQPKEADFRIVMQTEEKVVFQRKDFVGAIAHACSILGLDILEVNNKVYARAMNQMFTRLNLGLRHAFLAYQDGWYDEVIEKAS
jgi:hypothetical protein